MIWNWTVNFTDGAGLHGRSKGRVEAFSLHQAEQVVEMHLRQHGRLAIGLIVIEQNLTATPHGLAGTSVALEETDALWFDGSCDTEIVLVNPPDAGPKDLPS